MATRSVSNPSQQDLSDPAASLTPKQIEAANLILTGATWAAAATELGVARSTLYEWNEKPEFKAYMMELKARLELRYRDRFSRLVSGALDWLDSVIFSPDCSAALRTRVALAILVRPDTGPKSWNIPSFALPSFKSSAELHKLQSDKVGQFAAPAATKKQIPAPAPAPPDKIGQISAAAPPAVDITRRTQLRPSPTDVLAGVIQAMEGGARP